MARPTLILTAFALALTPSLLPAQAATDLFLVRFHEMGGQLMVEGVTRLTDRAGYDNQPHFLPDGQAVLYTSIDASGQADIHRIDLATLRSTRVTSTAPESEYSATPMPGGDRFSAIRVEADSTQRLWSFRMDGTDARLVIEDLRPVGYQAWVDSTRVVVFVLGDPATLRLVDTATGETRTVARNIGRAIQPIPGRRAVSFVQREGEGTGRILSLDVGSGAIAPLAIELEGNEYHAWTPAGVLVSGQGSTLVQWTPTGGGSWRDVADLASHGIRAISRIAVSPRGGTLVVVSAR